MTARVIPVGDKSYTHTQDVPASSWVVNHNLGRFVNVTVIDSAGTQWVVNVLQLSMNQCVVDMSAPMSGKAICS